MSLFYRYLRGEWHVKRTCDDSRFLPHIQHSTVIFNPFQPHEGILTNDVLSYDEKSDDNTFFQNRIFYCTNDGFAIHKQNNTLLHTFVLTAKNHFTDTHCHYCGKDVYDTTVVLLHEKCFKIIYCAQGVRKNYTLYTLFVKK